MVDQLCPLLLDGDLGSHLRFADLTFLFLDGDLGIEFTLLDRPLLLNRGVPAGVDSFVGPALQCLAGFSFEGAARFGGWLDGENRQRQNLDSKFRHQTPTHGTSQAPRPRLRLS